ncbi:hypothetical protein BHE90_003938 [Fusarium euwallaceae]|uniref:Maltose/galactoside acetyltransferase domain-containing protein n=3 Tax=Fusarium solani species complex TaxID=232080 RepID=A0A428TR20_9HYPO|nr:hypothetical protein CEP52_006820 [Fusarium oligoseptatum]RTE81523.1 hypothetical protein BHE90_003938 [Fusarium euwallaceae]
MASTEKNATVIEAAKTLNNLPWCNEYEKMISGIAYDCLAPELVMARFQARKMMHKFNNYFPDDATPESLSAEYTKMLKKMLGKVGEETWIEPPMTVDYGCNVSVGERFYSNFGLVILDSALVTIGSRVMFGPSVTIITATHDTDVQSRRDMGEYAKGVTIGDDCWIGSNVIIMPGITIGRGTTIGAGSVVTKDIPEFSVAVGSPAKVIKKVKEVPILAGRKAEGDGASV